MAACLSIVATSACIHHHDAASVNNPAHSLYIYNGRLPALCKAQKARYAESQRSGHADTELDEETTSQALSICSKGKRRSSPRCMAGHHAQARSEG